MESMHVPIIRVDGMQAIEKSVEEIIGQMKMYNIEVLVEGEIS